MRLRILTVTALAATLLLPTTAAQAAGVKGAVFYRYTDTATVYRYLAGQGFTKTKVGGLSQFSAAPDGRKVAWIDLDGKVHVTVGGTDKVIGTGAVAGAPCATPVWSADSKRVAYPLMGTEGSAAIVVVNADGTGRKQAGRTYGVCHLAWSANGRYLAGYAGTTQGVYLLDLVTGKSRKSAGIKLANHVQSLSPDGRKVIVHTIKPSDPGGDGGWPTWFPPTIVDTLTGAKVTVPVAGALIGAIYLRDGRLAVRVKGKSHHTIVVLSRTLKRVASFPEPASVKNSGLLQVL
ncbi:TolB family protein [Acrocarpospora catenulata]|uniref:TolB family protein n=1 Tax=Acrocarpospora catenulata TaxID=2836182 RepID=UPI001BD95347|nr:hypothetical protein [Acrocarpospora catenulata]